MSQEHCTTGGQENMKSNQKETALDAALHDAAEASRELVDLAEELRGLAREAKAGKVPRARQIERIARRLTRWDAEFNSLVLDLAWLVGEADREGYKKGLYAIPINDEPFKSTFNPLIEVGRTQPSVELQ